MIYVVHFSCFFLHSSSLLTFFSFALSQNFFSLSLSLVSSQTFFSFLYSHTEQGNERVKDTCTQVNFAAVHSFPLMERAHLYSPLYFLLSLSLSLSLSLAIEPIDSSQCSSHPFTTRLNTSTSTYTKRETHTLATLVSQ